MKNEPSCELVQLAKNDCCEVVFCGHCQVTQLRLGAMSLKLPVAVLQEISRATQDAMAYYQALALAGQLPHQATDLKPLKH
jgi:hypothetical protein